MYFPRLAVLVAIASTATAGAADRKVTYADDLLPMFRDNCLKCHNPDKQRGDLDLSNFAGTLKGGSSGTGPNAGDAEGSLLLQVMLHTTEPFMPPNSPKLGEKEVALIRDWIDGGMLETSGSKAIASSRPKVDLTLSAAPGKPEGPPPMPGDLILEPPLSTARQTAVAAMASSPWAPVFAVGSFRQVSLYHSDTAEFLGVLSYPYGFPHDLRFTRNGKMLMAAGGHDGKSGDVVLWDIQTGDVATEINGEYDSVLTADVSPNMATLAIGGTDRLLKIYDIATGTIAQKIKKHTDWVTAVEYSPDGKYLISGDRAGNVLLWDAKSAGERFPLNGHKGAITSVSWRSDSAMALTGSEDGTIKVWRPTDGQMVKSWNAHRAVTDARFGMDGNIVSAGRDGKATLWDVTGKSLKALALKTELPTRAVSSHDGARVWVADFDGWVMGFSAKDGKETARLRSVPPSLEERIRDSAARVENLTRREREAVAQAKAFQIALDSEKSRRATMQEAVAKAKSEISELQETLQEIDKRAASQAEAPEDAGLKAEAKAQVKEQNGALEKLGKAMAAADKEIADREAKLKSATTAVSAVKFDLDRERQGLLRWREAKTAADRKLASAQSSLSDPK